ncbi:Zinc finger protein 398 [Colletotrichum chlorophyti]|uniref:Zinc finger protein 398 n=1 Tax=Colletotrichum chlorophyti TaxID=708187 RepID=A0A1Q8S743_9PEZI|nr:Zinc finger protein 398 [Colletotrichum chlorophyti]
MASPSDRPSSSSATSNTHHSPYNTASSGLTSPSGVPGEGLSPLSSGVNTTSSQSSQYYQGHVQGSWPAPSSSYQLSSGTPQGLAQTSHYASRGSTYEQQSPMSYSRTSQSPATGEGLSAPQYGQTGHSNFVVGYTPHAPQGGAGSGAASLPSQAPPTPQPAILGSQASVSTQPPTPSGLSSHVDPFTQSRPPATPGYYSTSSASHHSGYPSYTSPTAPSPTTAAGPPRGLASLQHPTGMAPPGSYRYSYPVPSMGGPIMSNLTSPGHQMSLVPGMGVGGYGAHPLGPSMYGHGGHGPNPQTERPFKCDQCPQSFNRNHDLKRHKRIHLAVKPFPCSFCDKSFSRKDALKDRSDDGTPPRRD